MTPAVNYSLGFALLADRRHRALLVGFIEAGQLGVSAEIGQGRVCLTTGTGISPILGPFGVQNALIVTVRWQCQMAATISPLRSTQGVQPF